MPCLPRGSTSWHRNLPPAVPKPLSWQFYPVLPEDKVNLEGAERLKPEKVRQLETLAESVPSERTWGNRLRYPLVLIGDVVDIPLNIICGPIGLVHIWATRLTP